MTYGLTMSFRKRSTPLTNTANTSTGHGSKSILADVPAKQQLAPGVRSSPNFAVPTTSTGLLSLDSLLRLNAGLALGSSLVIEEDGTTDYAGAILRCFASEGVLQGHKVFIAAAEQWASGLPGLVVEKQKKEKIASKESSPADERMKIAWRYERMGLHGDAPGRTDTASSVTPFCHTFDLSTRLTRPSTSPPIAFIHPKGHSGSRFPDLASLKAHLEQSDTLAPVRLIFPGLLSPLFYDPQCAQPSMFIQFIHNLRRLTRKHENLCVMLSWPLALYPIGNTLTWWLERLCDGVLRLEPFPHGFSIDAMIPQQEHITTTATGKSSSKQQEEDKVQGLLRVTKLPLISDRGMGTGIAEDLAWALGRKKFIIRPFNLPPLEAEVNESAVETQKKSKDLEF